MSTIDGSQATEDTRIESLVRWGQKHGRRFPWRAERGFHLAVAEVLLQKTRGTAVEPVWRALLQEYPSAESLAAADGSRIEEIVGALGLGEQRTARLSALAASSLTHTPDKWRGLGSYGRGVVLLADGSLPDAAPVDGNVARVVSRLHDWTFERGEPRKKPEVREAVMELLGVADSGQRLDAFYSLVDVGATVCRPRRPLCKGCPLSSACAYVRREPQ